MIPVTRLDGAPMLLNVDLIESIEPTPDTLVCMSNGDKLYVRETPDDLLERVIQFKHAIIGGTGAHLARAWKAGEPEPWR